LGSLTDWAKERSPFVILADDETIKAKYKGFKIVPNRFDPEKETVRYLLEIDGAEKPWENGQNAVARVMDSLAKGTWVSITRTKESANKINYDIKVLDDKDIPASPEQLTE
jgi:hypothetical protein